MGEDKTGRSDIGDTMSAGELDATPAIASAMADANARGGKERNERGDRKSSWSEMEMEMERRREEVRGRQQTRQQQSTREAEGTKESQR
jgi:hypothetical protein